MPTISVLDSAGAAQLLQTPNGNGQALMAASRPVVLASDQSAVSVTLQAGAAIVGKAGIDQTTPGTTNNVTLSGITGVAVITSTQAADAKTAANTGLITAAYGMVFNGTTWDRQRGDTSGSVTQPFALASARWNYAAPAGGIVNSTAAVTIAAAAGAGVRNYLDSIQIDSDTLGAATEFAIRDGAAGTVLWRGKLGTAAQYGRSHTFADPLKGTANTLMEIVTLTASVTGGVFFNGQGHTAA